MLELFSMDYVISITEMLKLISDGITDMNKSNNHNKLNRKKMENYIQFFKLKKKIKLFRIEQNINMDFW